MWVNDLNENTITQEIADYLMDCEHPSNIQKVKRIFNKMYPKLKIILIIILNNWCNYDRFN